MILDLTLRTHLDADLYALDEHIADCTTPADYRQAEALARCVLMGWADFHLACIAALTITRRVDERCRLDAKLLRARLEVAEAVKYAAARALECGDRIRACVEGARRGEPEVVDVMH